MPRSQPYSRGFIAVCIFTGAYLAAAAVTAWVKQSAEFAFYLAVMLVLVWALTSIHRRAHFTLGLLWCLSLWGAMHMAGGLVPVPEAWPINGDSRVLYSWWMLPFTFGHDGTVDYGIKYDNVTHAYGFGITAWACWQGLCTTLRGERAAGPELTQPIRPTFGRLTLCFTGAMGFGALNEVVEFVATTLGPTNVGGYINTSYDLISNAVGSLIAVAVIRVWHRRAWGDHTTSN